MVTDVRISFHSLHKIQMYLYPGTLTYINKSCKGMLLPTLAFIFLIMFPIEKCKTIPVTGLQGVGGNRGVVLLSV